VTAWEAKCGMLRENGMKVKDLPKKPKRPLKLKVTVKVELEPSSLDSKLEWMVGQKSDGSCDISGLNSIQCRYH
jgi:hypothetical protein